MSHKQEAVNPRTGKPDICYLYLFAYLFLHLFRDWASFSTLDSLKLMAILLSQLLECCDYRDELTPPALLINVKRETCLQLEQILLCHLRS